MTVSPVHADLATQLNTLSLQSPVEGEDPEMVLRALVSSKEAGVIIGKGGKSVSHIREVTSVKIGVSAVVAGVNERILTVSGPLSAVAKVFYINLGNWN
jgi:heterogeneous nuclear rnp K-like protein